MSLAILIPRQRRGEIETMHENLENESEKEKLIIIGPEEWLRKSAENRENISRGVLCLEDLIRREFGGMPVRVLEVGPVPSILKGTALGDYELKHRAPIGALQKRNPELKCLAVGIPPLMEKERAQILGDVPYIAGILSAYESEMELFNKELGPVNDRIQNGLGGAPQIIYGEHMFENSPSGPKSFPLGPYKPFEAAAEMLAPGGFIVVDNAGGRRHQIPFDSLVSFPEISKLKERYQYTYDSKDGRSIYVFQKPF